MDHMRAFGCLAYAHVPSQQRSTHDYKAVKCISIGYIHDRKSYMMFNRDTYKAIVSRDVIFDENLVNPLVHFCK